MSTHRPVLIVSGLPRSGTSLQMQMLQAGGVPLLTDEERIADEHNPLGYFEFAPVKRLRQDATWISQAVGEAVKVVSPLLADLPTGYDYKVLLVQRSLAEVVASQMKLLATRGVVEPVANAEDLLQLYTRYQAEMEQTLSTRSDIEVLKLNHPDLMTSPAEQVSKITAFIQPIWPEIKLDQQAMIKVIDPQLHRVRR